MTRNLGLGCHLGCESLNHSHTVNESRFNSPANLPLVICISHLSWLNISASQLKGSFGDHRSLYDVESTEAYGCKS